MKLDLRNHTEHLTGPEGVAVMTFRSRSREEARLSINLLLIT
jgi:hypothetical protein